MAVARNLALQESGTSVASIHQLSCTITWLYADNGLVKQAWLSHVADARGLPLKESADDQLLQAVVSPDRYLLQNILFSWKHLNYFSWGKGAYPLL